MKKNYILFSVFISTFAFAQKTEKLRIDKLYVENLVANKEAVYNTNINFSQQSLLNFNPVILDYEKAQSLKLKQNFQDLSRVSVFTVYQSDPSLEEQELWSINTSDTKIDLTNGLAKNGKQNFSYNDGKQNAPSLNTYIQTYNQSDSFSNEESSISVGKFSTTEYKETKGVVAEILIYKGVLRGKARQAIESALALKYGITLDNGKNYLSSDKKVVFDIENSKSFSNRIAGIGRDSDNGLYQKQSRSTQSQNLLTISVGNLAKSNSDNTSEIEDQTFLVWGDNNAEVTEKASDKESLPMLQRQWLIKPTGNSASSLSTQVILDIAAIFKDKGNLSPDQYLLVIDKSGKGSFSPEHSQYIPATKMENNQAFFSDVQWDKDNTGTDVFTFAVRESLTPVLAEGKTQNCNSENSGVLDFSVKGGVAPYTYELKKDNVVLKTWKSKDGTYSDNKITQLGTAQYSLVVTDLLGEKKEVSYQLINPTPVVVNAGEDKRFEFEQTEMILQPSVSPVNTTNLTYQWTSENGFSSTSEKATITKSGTYTLNVTTEKGCMSSDTVIVKDSFVKTFSLYPNRSTDGNYDIQVELSEPSAFNVEVYDAMGKRVSSFKANENKLRSSIVKGKKINFTGYYTVILFNDQFKVSKKLIVE